MQYRVRLVLGTLDRHRVRRGDCRGRGERCRAWRRYRTVGNAVTAVYMFCCIPFGLAVLLMLRFVRIALGNPEAVSAHGGLEQRSQ
jgi:hypothetical protein